MSGMPATLFMRHVEEATGNVAQTCRYFGISGQAYCTRYRR
ncbi:hypothetical protein [Streptomyces sp. 8N616]